jgi:UDP-N-acetylmuramoylalanine--D-glutamate ligase
LPHRLENIWKFNWITFIDDGISTTPESTIEAINTFWEQLNTIFLGWWDYWFTQESYTLLKNKLIEHWKKNIVLFPDTGLDIFNIDRKSKNNWDEFNIDYKEFTFNILYSHSMKVAVEFAYKYTWDNNICLMSCAAPSYSLWTGYKEKWKEFKHYVELYN